MSQYTSPVAYTGSRYPVAVTSTRLTAAQAAAARQVPSEPVPQSPTSCGTCGAAVIEIGGVHIHAAPELDWDHCPTGGVR